MKIFNKLEWFSLYVVYFIFLINYRRLYFRIFVSFCGVLEERRDVKLSFY